MTRPHDGQAIRKRPHRTGKEQTMWKTVMATAAGAMMAAACGQFGHPNPGHPAPQGITGEIRPYAGCRNDASSKRFEQSHGRRDSERYAVARCRLLEPPAAYTHAPGSPENNRCSDDYFAWYRSRHQTVDKLTSRVFAETVCAGTDPSAGSSTPH